MVIAAGTAPCIAVKRVQRTAVASICRDGIRSAGKPMSPRFWKNEGIPPSEVEMEAGKKWKINGEAVRCW